MNLARNFFNYSNPWLWLGTSLFVFGHSLFFGFVHDDWVLLVKNPQILHFDFKNIFVPVVPLDLATQNFYYRPLLIVWHWLIYALFGMNPWAFHAFNIIVHGLNAYLLFRLLSVWRLTSSASGFGALLFLIHPVQTQAVVCIAGISNLAVMSCVLLFALAYYRRNILLSVLFLVMGLLTKEIMVIAAIAIMLIDYFLNDKKKPAVIFISIGCIVLFLAWRNFLSPSHAGNMFSGINPELIWRLKSVPAHFLEYMRIVFMPYDLHYYRNFDFLLGQKEIWEALAIILVIVLMMYLWLKNKTFEKKYIGAGFIFFSILILPFCGIVPLINEYSFLMAADHFLYLPMIGISIIAAVLWQGTGQLARQILIGVLAVMVTVTVIYQQDFKDEIAIFKRMVAFEPTFARGQMLLAKSYLVNNQPKEAITHYQIALERMQWYESRCAEGSKVFYRNFINEIQTELSLARQMK